MYYIVEWREYEAVQLDSAIITDQSKWDDRLVIIVNTDRKPPTTRQR
jgi:hypothetical protein